MLTARARSRRWNLAGLVVVVFAGALLPITPIRCILLTGLILVLVGPLIVRRAQRRFDLFEPIVWTNLSLAALFVLRPLAQLLYGSMDYRLIDISPQFDYVLVVALTGSVAVQLGYFGTSGRHLARVLPRTTARVDVPSLNVLAAAFAGIALLAMLVFGEDNTAAGSAYLYYLPLLIIPAAFLSLAAGLQPDSAASRPGALILVAIVLVMVFPSGQRLWLMLLVVPLVVWRYLRSHRRPALRGIVGFGIVAFVVVVSLRDLPPTSGFSDVASAVASTVSDLPRSAQVLVLGADTEMFPALAREVAVVPSRLGYHPGYTLLSLVAHPIPRAVWPDKPRQSDDLLNAYFYGDVGYRVGNAGVAYSVFGGLYYDSGLIGVFLGAILVGVLGRAIWSWYLQEQGTELAAIILSTALPFFVVLVRGNYQDTFARVLFILVPLCSATVVTRVHSVAGDRRRGVAQG